VQIFFILKPKQTRLKKKKPIQELRCMENAFNAFTLFFPENISATLLLALQVRQIYLASQCHFFLQF